jgi:hypothetical protein
MLCRAREKLRLEGHEMDMVFNEEYKTVIPRLWCFYAYYESVSEKERVE